MNFQQLVGRCFKPTEVVSAVDRTAICRPSVHSLDGRPITNHGYQQYCSIHISPFTVSRRRRLYMFHKPQDLLKRTPADGINRPEFLKQLVQEFRKTNSSESKLQVLANLANFAYDPVNYQHIRTQKVIDLFIEQLASDDNQLIAFAAAGLCNLVNDPVNKDYVIGNGGIQNIENNLSKPDDNIILSCITTLMYLYAPEIKTDIVNPSIVGYILSHAQSENPKLRNVAKIFLTDFCTEHDIQTAITSNT